jgi:WD40 repeat protein
VNCVAWSPDGRYIASGGDDKTVQVWEAASSVHLFTYQGHDEGIQDVQSVAWAPDGRLIVSSPLVGKVQVWKAVDGELVFSASEGMGLSSVAWSHNNKYIAFFGDRDIVSIWDVTTSTRCLTYEGHYHPSFRLHARMFAPRHGLAWSPNDMCIATTGYDETLQIWDAITGRTLLTIKYTPRYRGSVAWAPFGLHIAFVGHSDHSSAKSRTAVQVCDVVTGDALLTYQGHLEELEAVAWSPSGRHIASAGKGKTVQIWEAATGKHIFTYRGHSAAVNSVAWSSDGTRIASASDDGTVQVWQVV